MTQIMMRIRGHTLPGLTCGGAVQGHPQPYDRIHLGIQRGREVVNIVPGDAKEAVFEFPVDIADSPDGGAQFRGPFVQRRLPQQFVYLSWGEVKEPAQFNMFRRAKLHLTTVEPGLLQQVIHYSGVLEASLSLTDRRGNPLCASVKPPLLKWSVVGSR
ncbi:MAG TPA: DUF5990 family protein [Chloroflexota bacterium]|nr:DUF5990 family protein [Chloroflexota bacterium]